MDDLGIQRYFDSWWTSCEASTPRRGQLCRAFVPHVDLTPQTLIPEARVDARDHSRATFTLGPLRVRAPRSRAHLPVAGLPQLPGEVYSVHRAKTRPCLIISTGGGVVSKELRPSTSPKWQTAPTLLVAPYYGAPITGERSGWYPPLIERIRQCEYPQFILDRLPDEKIRSVLRLDHIQPIGRHHESYELLPYRLCDGALELLDDWLVWLRTGDLAEDSMLAMFRSELMNNEGTLT